MTLPPEVVDAIERINEAAKASEAFCNAIGQLMESGALPTLSPLEAQLAAAAVFAAAVEEDTPGADPVKAFHQCVVAVSVADKFNAQTQDAE